MSDRPNNSSVVAQIMLEYRQALLDKEAAQFAQMTSRWIESEKQLQSAFDALALEIENIRLSGEDIPIGKVIGLQRFRELLAQVREEINKYNDYAEGIITKQQFEYGKLGAEQAANAIQTTYTSQGIIKVSFNRLPVAALENFAGVAGDGSPLKNLLEESYTDAAENILKQLQQAILLGKNPRDTARAMRDGYGVAYNRALTISRTEQLRVYREAARQQYAASGVTKGYRRISAKQPETCLACLILDGKFYENQDELEEHVSGRCTLVPVVIGLSGPQWQTGKDWLLSQPESTQRYMFEKMAPPWDPGYGTRYFDAWKSGQFELDSMVQTIKNDKWGPSIGIVPLSKLIKK